MILDALGGKGWGFERTAGVEVSLALQGYSSAKTSPDEDRGTAAERENWAYCASTRSGLPDQRHATVRRESPSSMPPSAGG